MDAAPELFVGEQGKPAFDKVEPASRSRCEVQMEARSFHQPVADQLCFVCSVVVQDQVYVQFRRHVSFNRVEEVAKPIRKDKALPLRPPLRTGHESFPSSGSSHFFTSGNRTLHLLDLFTIDSTDKIVFL